MNILEFCGRKLAGFLTAPAKGYAPAIQYNQSELQPVIKVGDVLLVEGEQRVSSAIKYLTQSTWSHAAIYVGDFDGKHQQLVEADMQHGVRSVALDFYQNFHVRICRPVHLREEDKQKLLAYLQSRLGDRYDLKNVLDLLRYLLPNPPVPQKWRRGMLALGSGEPTEAICSTLLAQAFASIHYPILPIVHKRLAADVKTQKNQYVGILRERNYSLYVPRDFDVSPYFQIIKPCLERGFDYKNTLWE